MKTCPYCQKSIADDSVYCENCGKQIGEVEKNKSKIVAYLWAVIVLLVLACGALGFLYYQYYDLYYNKYCPLDYVADYRSDSDVRIHHAYIQNGYLNLRTSSLKKVDYFSCKINVYNGEDLVKSIPISIQVPQGVDEAHCGDLSLSPGIYTKLEIWKDDERLYTLHDVQIYIER